MNTKHASTLAIAGTLSALALTIGAMPTASAVVPVDRPLISAGNYDFGGSFAAGVPVTGGTLRWETTPQGVVRPKLTGNLKLTAGACGRIQVEYFNPVNHNQLATRTTATSCGPSTTVVQVDNFADALARHVHINLQRQSANGSYTTVGSVIEDR